MYYSTASSGEIILGDKFSGAEYQIHFPGKTSKKFYVCASLFARGTNFEIGYQYYFDEQGKLINGSHFHTDSKGFEILNITRRNKHEALSEFLKLRPIFSSIMTDGRLKVKPEYRPTIDTVCQGAESVFRN